MSDTMYATYKNLRSGDIVYKEGLTVGKVVLVAFDVVLINWYGINPPPLPPIYYPSDVWNFQFGLNCKIEQDG